MVHSAFIVDTRPMDEAGSSGYGLSMRLYEFGDPRLARESRTLRMVSRASDLSARGLVRDPLRVRRRVLSATGVVASVLAVAIVITPAPRADAAAQACKPPTEKNGVITADLAVVGAHAAGFGAAIAAARHCVSVVLISSETHPGGMLTAGQIGFTDGLPNFYWPDRTSPAGAKNGDIPPYTSWALTGGVWRNFRAAISSNLPSTLRFTPATAAAAADRLLRLPSLLVLRNTSPISANMAGSTVGSVSVAGAWTGQIHARYWIDGSDTGDLVGLLKLPYDLSDDVMAYAYRWTAIADNSGAYPTAPPPYYSINVNDFNTLLARRWPTYQADFQIATGASFTANPFRFFNNQGRIADAPPEKWDVNNGANDATSLTIGAMLKSDASTTELLARNGLPNVYADTTQRPHWGNISWIEDLAPLTAADKLLLIAKIKDAVKARASSLLWYIRSGDMQAALHKLPGAENVNVQSGWSRSNELGTTDGFPELMYQREGRRVVAERQETIYDLCPSFDSDRQQAQQTPSCSTPPRYLADGIAVADYAIDIKDAGTTKPFVFVLPRPYQVSFASLIPKGTRDLLVGGALGADFYTYGALRVDPTRLLIGGALGEAVALAQASNLDSFQELSVEKLREALATAHQETFYTQLAPTWTNGWHDDRLGVTLQKLIARGLITHDWNPNPEQGSAILPSSLDLSGTNSQRLMKALHGHCDVKPPWARVMPGSVTPLHAFVRGAHGSATVADAYTWLLAHCTAS